MSTIAVRDAGGYFDPFRGVHYKDPQIIEVYTTQFLVAHELACATAFPICT